MAGGDMNAVVCLGLTALLWCPSSSSVTGFAVSSRSRDVRRRVDAQCGPAFPSSPQVGGSDASSTPIVAVAMSTQDGDDFDFEEAMRRQRRRMEERANVQPSAGGGERRRPETTSFGAEAVPEEQRPANEYLDLIRQPLFGWASQESGDKGLAVRLAATYVAFFAIVCYPIAGATFVEEGYLLQRIAAANVGAFAVLLVLLLRLYAGWNFVGTRLQSRVVEYEQTGWYDGDFEPKTETERARDLFLYRKDVRPVEERIKVATLAIGGLLVASTVGFNAATAAKPLFNEYDTEMLKVLQSDDKMAEIAARQSNGRPTYCDSRYYRAIANGGQGCN